MCQYLVVLVENVLHDGPETLLPLEHCFLRHYVRGDAGLERSREEVMRERLDVVQGVVVDHGDVALIIQDASVDDDRFLTTFK